MDAVALSYNDGSTIHRGGELVATSLSNSFYGMMSRLHPSLFGLVFGLDLREETLMVFTAFNSFQIKVAPLVVEPAQQP